MLIDKVKIYVKAGNGGNGAVSFHREKYVARGGPDGGDGGNGGSIILYTQLGDTTLQYYKYNRKFVAENGENGKGDKFHGKRGEDIRLPVPLGTVIRDAESGRIIKDMSSEEEFVLCRGGRGGWGNKHFATPTRQIPRFAKSGILGQEREVILELKMLADVGLIGLPNVGKSTILSVISGARPKIANYHFTTLSPNLGVVELGEGRNFVVADIPGLIEGAAEGAGLGHRFLRHVERCRLFLHVVDVSGSEGRDPIADIKTVNDELEAYDLKLLDRPQIIIANKYDVAIDNGVDLAPFEAAMREMGYEFIYVCATERYEIDRMITRCEQVLRTLPPMTVYESEMSIDEMQMDTSDHSITVTRENQVYVVEGEWLYRLMGNINFEDRESLMYFHRVLRNSGVIDKLEQAGVVDGDTVSIYDFEFDFVK